MTQQADGAGLRIVTRWRELAERRLEHLVELYESGRWRRYHTEEDFLDNVRDAKRAVALWQRLTSDDPDTGELDLCLSWIRPMPARVAYIDLLFPRLPKAAEFLGSSAERSYAAALQTLMLAAGSETTLAPAPDSAHASSPGPAPQPDNVSPDNGSPDNGSEASIVPAVSLAPVSSLPAQDASELRRSEPVTPLPDDALSQLAEVAGVPLATLLPPVMFSGGPFAKASAP